MLIAFCAPAATAGDAAPAPGTIIVSTRADTHIVLLCAQTGREIAKFDAGMGAHEIACSPDGRLAVGSAYGSGPRHQTPDQRLLVVDLPTRTVARVIDLGDEHPRPNDLVFFPDGRHALCTSEVRQSVLKIDILEGKIAREYPFGVRAGHMLAVSPDFTRAYVPSIPEAVVVAIDLDSGEVAGKAPTAFGSEGVACSPDGATIWVANNRSECITVVSTADMTPIQTIPCIGFPFRIRFTPDGGRVVVTCAMLGELRVFDAKSREVLGSVPLGDAPAESSPTSVVCSPDSRHAYVVCAGIGAVAAVDLHALKPIWQVEAGPGADGLAWSCLPAGS